MNNTHNQKGFSAVEAITILVVLAVLAFGGWYLWKSNNKDTDKQAANTTSAPESDADESDATSKQYLAIDEWGIKVNVGTDANADKLGYSILEVSPRTPDILSASILYKGELPADDAVCATTGILINRTAVEQNLADDVYQKQIGDFWYSIGYADKCLAATAITIDQWSLEGSS